MSLVRVIILSLFILCISCSKDKDGLENNRPSSNLVKTSANDLTESYSEPAQDVDFSELVQRYESKSREEWQKPDEVLELLGDVEGMTIADIGAGTGYFSFRLLYLGAEVIATEIDERFLDWMENQAKEFAPDISERLTTRRVSPNSSGLNRAEVDGIIMINTSSYISDKESYFSTLKSGMKPGARAVIVDFKTQRVPVDAPDLEDRAVIGFVERDLLKAGFKIERIHESLLDFQWIIVAEAPME